MNISYKLHLNFRGLFHSDSVQTFSPELLKSTVNNTRIVKAFRIFYAFFYFNNDLDNLKVALYQRRKHMLHSMRRNPFTCYQPF